MASAPSADVKRTICRTVVLYEEIFLQQQQMEESGPLPLVKICCGSSKVWCGVLCKCLRKSCLADKSFDNLHTWRSSNSRPHGTSWHEIVWEDSTAWGAQDVPLPEEPTNLWTTPSELREELPGSSRDFSKVSFSTRPAKNSSDLLSSSLVK